MARLPARIRTLASGLTRLAPETWRLAEVAAAMSQPFSADALAPVIGQPLGRLQPALSDAVAAGVLTQSGAWLRFRHDVVRQAIYYETPLPKRMSLHRRIEGVEEAKRRTRARPSEADRPHAEDRAPSAEGSVASARGAVVALAPGEPEPGEAPTGPQGNAQADAGPGGTGLREPTAGSGSPARPEPAGWVGTDDIDAVRARAEAVFAGNGLPDGDGALAVALVDLAFVAWNEGRIADAVALLEAGGQRAARCSDLVAGLVSQFAMAVVFTALADFPKACAAIGALDRAVRAARSPRWAPVPSYLRARLSLALGPAADADAATSQAVVAATQEQPTPFGTPVLLVQAQRSLSRGDLDTAEELLQRLAEGPAEGRSLTSRASLDWVRAQVAETRLGAAAAYDAMAGVYADPVSHTRLLVEEPSSGPWLVRVAVAAGETSGAEKVARWSEQLAALNRRYSTMSSAGCHARALLDRDVDALERLGTEHSHACGRAAACEDAGTHLAVRGDKSRARRQFERALAIFECMGAVCDQARLRQRLADLASGPRRQRPGCRPVSGWDSLTDAERRVAELVVSGLTNPETAARLFLSRHTVDFHLRHVFRKLNVGSRVELTRMALLRD